MQFISKIEKPGDVTNGLIQRLDDLLDFMVRSEMANKHVTKDIEHADYVVLKYQIANLLENLKEG